MRPGVCCAADPTANAPTRGIDPPGLKLLAALLALLVDRGPAPGIVGVWVQAPGIVPGRSREPRSALLHPASRVLRPRLAGAAAIFGMAHFAFERRAAFGAAKGFP